MDRRPPFKWRPITDLPEHWRELANVEMPALVRVWDEQARALRESQAYLEFLGRMRREIAIETGVIERLYTIDRGITRLLIEEGIDEALIPHGTSDRPASEVVAMIRDHEKAIDNIMDLVGGETDRQLSTSFVKQLHQVLTQHQPTVEAVNQFGRRGLVAHERGVYKRFPNNPLRPDGEIHEYAPPEQVSSEMDKLVVWHHAHMQEHIPPEIESAWLHHRFTQIHPFQDGNGRVARMLASLVFLKARWFPLVITRDQRVVYIEALESADHGDLSALVSLFVESQKRAFVKSLSLSDQVLTDIRQPVSSYIEALADSLRRKRIQERTEIERMADGLYSAAYETFQRFSGELAAALKEFGVSTSIAFGENKDSLRRGFNRYQVIEAARKLDYYGNLREYHSWISLRIEREDDPSHAEILLSIHVLGRDYRGVMACSVCSYWKDASTDDGVGKIARDIKPMVDLPLEFSYADLPSALDKRFRQWLEPAIMAGLEYWRKST